MVDRLVDVVDDRDRQIEAHVLGGEVRVGRRDRVGEGAHDALVAVHRHAGGAEGSQHRRQQAVGRVRVHEQGLERVADARPADLRVDDDVDGHLLVGARVEEDVHDARAGLDHGHRRLAHDGLDQLGAAARHEHVDQPARPHELGGPVPAVLVDRHDRVGRQSGADQRLLHDVDEHLVRFSAALPPRSTTALPLFSASAAMSTVTFGRAS